MWRYSSQSRRNTQENLHVRFLLWAYVRIDRNRPIYKPLERKSDRLAGLSRPVPWGYGCSYYLISHTLNKRMTHLQASPNRQLPFRKNVQTVIDDHPADQELRK